jgi:hypothetical protein
MMIHKEIKKICPNGRNSALGGQYKRNFWTLNTDILIIICWAIDMVLSVIIYTNNEEIMQRIGI